jgi:hypothetical protein
MSNPIRNLAVATALALTQVSSFAYFGDLSPGVGVQGAGNIGGGRPYGSEPGAFYLDDYLYMRWRDTSVSPSNRFMDLVGHVGSVSTSSGLSPFVFTGIELYSQDTQSLVGRFSSNPGSGQIDFTFARLSDGAYKIRFIGMATEEPPDGWAVKQWGYAFSAVASPAPEASDLALTVLGLAATVTWARRHRQASRRSA